MKFRLYTLAASLLFGTSLIAKELPPAGGQPKDFTLTETNSFTLDNGLTVTMVPYGNTPKVTVRLVTKTGNYDDGGKDAISDLSYDLLTEGTSNRSALEIAQAAASMGGEVETSVGANSSFIQIDVLSEFVGDASALIADLAINTVFTEGDLERSKTNFLRAMDVRKSQAQGQANEAFYQAIYAEHPYGNYFPDNDNVNSIKVDDVNSFVKNNLVAKRSHLYVSGKFDESQASKAIRQAFASMSSGTPRDVAKPDYQGAGKFVFVPRENAPQSTIRIGLPVVDPSHDDYIGLQLMNTLLGGSFASRITSNIREDKGYTYSPRSTISSNVNSALWYEGADVTAESTAASLAEIIKEIRRLQSEVPTSEELEGFKNYVAGIYVLQNSSRTAIINQLWFLELHGLPLSRLESYVQKVTAVTPEQLSALTKQYLTLDKMTLVIVGDETGVLPQIAEEPLLSAWLEN